MNRIFYIALILAASVLFSTPSPAEVVLDDGFTDASQVDLARTTARVDTVNNCVLLPWQSLSSSVSMLENALGYATASKEGIRLYELNDATGRVELNPIYSCPWATDATGVSVRQDNLNVWAITPDSIAYYRFNGSGMSNDPALKITGLVDVLSVAAFKNSDSALVLQKEGITAKITRYDAAGSLNPSLEFTTAITDPVAVSVVDNSPDFMLFAKDAAYYFIYDEAGGTYVEDPSRRITGFAIAVSGSSDSFGSSILMSDDLAYYMNLDGGGAARVDVFSPGPVAGPVAVSLKPGSCDQVFMDENGGLQWWTYDDAAGRMVRNPGLEAAGLILNRGYGRPRSYYSEVLNTPSEYDAVRLTVSEAVPPGTSVAYSVSSDGGLTFTGITPGNWAAVPRGSRFVVGGLLDTAEPLATPKILRVILEVDEDIILKGRVIPDPVERGRNAIILAGAVSLTSGTAVALDSCLVRYPLETKANGEPALPEGDLPTDAFMNYNPGTGWWEHTFTVPGKTVAGRWPDDGVYRVEITGVKGAAQKQITLNLEVLGHVLNRLVIKTLNW